MKKVFTAAVFVILIIAFAAALRYRLRDGGQDKEYKKLDIYPKVFKSINIAGASLDVEILQGADYLAQGRLADGETLSFGVEDYVLQIVQERELCDKSEHKCKGDKIKISVPRDFACDYLKVSLISGEVRVKGLLCSGLELGTVSGDVAVISSSAGSAAINTSSGGIDIENTEIASADIKSVSGYVAGKGITLYEARIDTTSGDIGLEGVFRDLAALKTVSGGIDLSSGLPAGKYHKTAATESGEIRINGAAAGKNYADADTGAVNKITAASVSGDINLSFAQ